MNSVAVFLVAVLAGHGLFYNVIDAFELEELNSNANSNEEIYKTFFDDILPKFVTFLNYLSNLPVNERNSWIRQIFNLLIKINGKIYHDVGSEEEQSLEKITEFVSVGEENANATKFLKSHKKPLPEKYSQEKGKYVSRISPFNERKPHLELFSEFRASTGGQLGHFIPIVGNYRVPDDRFSSREIVDYDY